LGSVGGGRGIDAVLWTRAWVFLMVGFGLVWVGGLRLGFRGISPKEVGGSRKKSGFRFRLWKSCVEINFSDWAGFWFE
jgi:hypothetical protein